MTNLLIENVDSRLVESFSTTDDKGVSEYWIKGIFLQAEIVNQNNRIYPKQILDAEVNRYINKKVLTNRGCGELEHPEEERDDAINLRFVSHKITELTQDGNNWLGVAKIAKNTHMGSIVCGLMDVGINFGVSSRARGTVKRMSNGVNVVQSDFRLITPADIVADPSAPDALVTSIMESKEWIYDNGILTEREIDDVKSVVNKVSGIKKLDESMLKNIFDSIINTSCKR